MRINNLQNNRTAFGSVTPIIATQKGAEKLAAVLTTSKTSYILEDLTHLYQNTHQTNIQNAIKQDKKILFLVTGEEYTKYMNMDFGWGSETAPTRHIDRCLEEITEKSNAAIARLLRRVNGNR